MVARKWLAPMKHLRPLPENSTFELFNFICKGPKTGEAKRDKGIAQVSGNNQDWIKKAMQSAIAYVCLMNGEDFTGELIRFHVRESVGEPRHPNAWGALISALIKQGEILETGEHRKMKDPRSHARKTPVYHHG